MNRISKTLGDISLLFFGIATANGQPLMDGKVSVENLAVSRSEDKLFVSMDMNVSSLELISNREVVLTPSLCKNADTLLLPAVTVAGRNRYFHHLRNGIESDAALYRAGTADVLAYKVVIPYQDWMNDAVLSVSNAICGCCSEKLGGGTEQLLALELSPKAFVPVYLYMRPDAKPKINVIEGTAYVDFPVNRTEIYETYRRNPVELQKILSTVDAVRNDADVRIISIGIKGYASPESPYENNERLAKGRTMTLREYVRKQYDFPDSVITVSYDPEDWAGLERFVEGSSLNGRDGILRIIRSGMDPDAKEWKIKKEYPQEYAYLLENVYPALRHSDYSVKYEVRSYTDVNEIKRLLRTQPQKLSLNEMYLAAKDMEPGSDEYNETFEIAVRMFPEDEVANLNAANTAMRLHDMKNASRYLQKAGTSPMAVYARGIFAALDGDLDAALALFAQAQEAGIPEAAEMISRIEELQ